MSLLTLSLIILCSLNQAASEVYYITTNSADLCIMQPCLTLSQFAAISSHSLHSNTTLVFFPGTHHLSNVNLILSSMDNFVMKSESSTAQIKCISESTIAMHFSRSQHIHITNLEFIGCGGNQVRYVEEFVVKDTKFEGQDNSSTALELIETTAQIVNGTFVSNRKGSYRECIEVFGHESGCLFEGFVGGAIIAINSTVDISRSRFEDNKADLGGAISAEQESIINMSDNVFVSNSASSGGGVLYSSNSTIIIKASVFHDNNASNGSGGALASNNSAIRIKVSEFHDNSAANGGVLASSSCAITIEASKFHNNSAIYWGGVLVSISAIRVKASDLQDYNAFIESLLHYNSSTITIETVASEFYDNFAYDGGVLDSSSSTVIIEASEFHDNYAISGGVLYSSHNRIKIETSEFCDNNATNRGGVLYSQSTIITSGGSRICRRGVPVVRLRAKRAQNLKATPTLR